MQYLTIIRKAEFVDLFKYGHLHVRRVTAFEGEIQDLKDNVEKFEEVTSDMNLFEYSFEYLMLHLSSDKEISSNPEIELSDVCGVYVFNEEAKKEMSISFDPRIQIHVSNWSPLFNKLQEKLLQRQSMRGVDNLWKIFELDNSDKAKCSEIIDDEIVSETFRELYAYERPHGELSPWVYLLRYERHSLYPRLKSGFFCDFIHVYINWMQREELLGDVAETTELYKQLDKEKFVELVHVVEQSPLSLKCKADIPGCNFYIVAPLYLYLKSLSGDNLEWNKEIENIVNYSKKEYGIDFAIATYLLGITLGYDGTYDCLYNRVGLSIFKPRVLPSEPSSEQEDDPVSNNAGKENEIGSDDMVQEQTENDIIPDSEICKSNASEDSTLEVKAENSSNSDALNVDNKMSEQKEDSASSDKDAQSGSDDKTVNISHENGDSVAESATFEGLDGTIIESKINLKDPASDSDEWFGAENKVRMHKGTGKKRQEVFVLESEIDTYRNQGWKKARNQKK